ncbi:hypothetical protein ACHAXR_012761 [Thalassiosira sp. AJA248-18]
MKVLRSLFTTTALLSAVGLTSAAKDKEYEYGRDPKKDAEYDISMGMAGVQQAAKDPKLLAQLMQDMQDPELMAEAKKMMESPEWKKKMKDLTNDKAFKSNVDRVKQTMEDPNEAAKMQAKMEHMMKKGASELHNDAKDTMATAMQAMADPTAMAEAARMMKDPQFQQQLSQMAKDPSFKKYVNAMQDMMQDPSTKRQMEQMADSFRSAL